MQELAGIHDGFGIQIQFRSFPDIELAFESLARDRSGIELMNVKHDEQRTYATVFIPEGKLDHFEKLIREYIAEKRDVKGRPRDHGALINTIEDIRTAAFEALWTDADEALPASDNENIWWEVWLPVRGKRQATIQKFRTIAETIGFRLAEGELVFPERTVVLMCGTKQQIQQSIMLLKDIAELRRAKETADFYDSLPMTAQRDIINQLLSRTIISGSEHPSVCILDTGVNNGHPLLAQFLNANDLHTIYTPGETSDESGHGTQMAGIALYGDLTDLLASGDQIPLTHRLESVKLLQNDGANEGMHYGHLTVEAVSRPEVTWETRRIACVLGYFIPYDKL